MRLGKCRRALRSLSRGICAVLLLSIVVPTATAQITGRYNSAEVLAPVAVDIASYRVLGDNPLSSSATQAILQPYTGAQRSIADIEAAVKDLEAQLKKAGYSFYRVAVTSQELVGGEIELTINRYRIGQIRVTGNRFYSDQNILASVPQLTTGASPSTALMSRSLRVANQNSGKRTLLQLEASPVPNQLDASIQVVDQQPRVLSAWLNNTGTEVTGRYRVGLGFEHRNLFDRDHVINLSFITAPDDFDAVQQTALSYQMPAYKLGGRFNFLAVNSDIDTGTVADVFDVAGRGDVFGFGYTQVLPSWGKFRHQLNAQITDKYFENDIQFSGQQIGPDVRSRPLSINYQVNWQSENVGLGLAFGYNKNLSGGRFNDEQSYTASRAGANRSWDSYSADFSLQYHWNKWLFSGNVHYAGSSDRLITGEQFALGGANSVRGMEERELSGDKGIRLGLQAWLPQLKNGLRPVLFIDAGQVKTNQPGPDEPRDDSVASAGLSLYWNPVPKLNLAISFAHLFEGIDLTPTATSDTSEDGNNKIHFNLAYRF